MPDRSPEQMFFRRVFLEDPPFARILEIAQEVFNPAGDPSVKVPNVRRLAGNFFTIFDLPLPRTARQEVRLIAQALDLTEQQIAGSSQPDETV